MENIREQLDKFKNFDPDLPRGYVTDETLIEKLSNAIVMKEWPLVEEVRQDLKFRGMYKSEDN